AAEQSAEYAVKAAFLANFVKFIEWPQGTLNGNTIVVGVIGRDPFGRQIDDLMGKASDSKKVVVKRIDWSGAGAANMVFVPASEQPNPDAIAKLIAKRVVVVGESAGFASKGGVIGFVMNSGRISFEINVGSARNAGVTLSSRLLQLAKIVGK
ncbi:MAG TPA: YfiR family protein, partial [Fimbriimonadaceae bacterium]|nr:YfiR family protein [Fimbriimonadaceae bacterium]